MYEYKGRMYRSLKKIERQKRREQAAAKKKARKANKHKRQTEKNQRKNELTRMRKASIPSEGERLIMKFLFENQVEFVREHYFKKCRNTTGYHLYFDFYLPKYKLLIEFDGIQHFEAVRGQATFEKQRERDQLKDEWVYENGFNLLRIPYYNKDRIAEIICKEVDRISPITQTA